MMCQLVIGREFFPLYRGPMQTMVGTYGSENRDPFLRFGWFLFVSAFLMNFGQYIGMKLCQI